MSRSLWMSSNPTWIDYRELQTAPKRKQQDDFPHEYICVSEGAANAYLPEMDFISRVCFLCAHFDISSGYFSDDEFILTYYRHCSYHERRHTSPPHQSPHISQMLCAAPWVKVIAIQLTIWLCVEKIRQTYIQRVHFTICGVAERFWSTAWLEYNKFWCLCRITWGVCSLGKVFEACQVQRPCCCW